MSTTLRRSLVPLLVAGVLMALTAGLLPASAATGTYLRLAHLSPDTPNVDVTVTSFGRPDWSVRLGGVGYGDVSGYQRIEPGTYTIAMRPAGADPASAPVISATLDAGEGNAYTVAGLGKFDGLALRVLNDDISLPPNGQARMRVVNAAPNAGNLTIDRAGQPVTGQAVFGAATDYALVPSGASAFQVAPIGAGPTELSVTLDPGGVYTVLVLEREGRLVAEVKADAKGAEVVPAGGVETGFGGTADATGTGSADTEGSGVEVVALGLLLAACAAGGLFAAALPRRRRA
ncbi:hypothetical protein UO65_3728 [Actinokineospora spheciospongiae]|uniref:DUF4397 domain-containing protein n=1 Tax=Actinokineospora spheciospongiae TaxID=909613 RepID=W7IJF8_9PSEU|nr:DUF4397 domain-containing protein [Actinokineospora spheciospongiae]EWC60995.1 hypothetical protein UO65_3728 [Actinokineospora spheciospongiae]